jgi:heat shock protein HspQ
MGLFRRAGRFKLSPGSPGTSFLAAGAEQEAGPTAMTMRTAKFQIGEIVRHRVYPFRGVIFDVDPVFANTEEWWLSIPEEVRPSKDQPYYHLLAENEETSYVAYVSEQNLLPDGTGEPVGHPQVGDLFSGMEGGRYVMRDTKAN